MSAVIDASKEYPKDTIGYHYKITEVVFGSDSKSLDFLQKKADESSKGFDERVILPESQVVFLLAQIHFGSSTGGKT